MFYFYQYVFTFQDHALPAPKPFQWVAIARKVERKLFAAVKRNGLVGLFVVKYFNVNNIPVQKFVIWAIALHVVKLHLSVVIAVLRSHLGFALNSSGIVIR